MRKTIIAAAALVTFATGGILGLTAGVANAAPLPIQHRATWAVYVTANNTGKVIKVDWPIYSLTAAQTDAVRERQIYGHGCTVLPAACVTVTIRQVTR